MNYYSAEAFVLRKEPSDEKDAIYHFFTREFGRLNLFTKGTRNILAKLAGHLEIPSLVEINFSLTHQPRLISAIEKNPYSEIKNNEKALMVVLELVNLIEQLTYFSQRDDEVFNLLFEVFYFMENNLKKFPKVIDFCGFYFKGRFLAILGYAPFLAGCLECGNKNEAKFFDFSKKGLVCPRHRQKIFIPIDPQKKKILFFLFNAPLKSFSNFRKINEVLKEEKFLDGFLNRFTLTVKSDII